MPTDGDVSRVVTVDASAVVSLLIDPGGAGERVADILSDSQLVSPELLHVEVANVLRRRRSAALLTHEQAAEAFTTLCDLPVTVWPFRAMATRVWELGDNLSTYDACYVALAEHTSSPLITRDARIARAPGPTCEVLVID